jgi:Lrp/AsnC ligand binding domain
VESRSFERWLGAMPPVLHAVLVTGDVDYELRLECRSFADLGDAATRICGYPGVEVESAAVVHHEAAGLTRHGRTNSNGVTLRRQRTM